MLATAPCLACALLAVFPLAQAPVPGTFFWKPRVGLDINIVVPTPYTRVQNKPSWKNIFEGYVVMIDGYRVGITVLALFTSLQDINKGSFPHLSPFQAHYYTNAYRWAIRHLSLLPEWFASRDSRYVGTHRVWKKRFFFIDFMVPKWIRKLLFFVDPASWEYEDWEMYRFMRYTEAHFAKYYVYPSKVFNNFSSVDHNITVENMDRTSNSLDHYVYN